MSDYLSHVIFISLVLLARCGVVIIISGSRLSEIAFTLVVQTKYMDGTFFSDCSHMSGFMFLSESNKMVSSCFFECEFVPFRIQTLFLFHPCKYYDLSDLPVK